MYPNEGFDGTDYSHTVIRVTVKNGDVYVLDMAGAQYGWHEPVIPWPLYNASRVRDIKDVLPFGGTTQIYRTRATETGGQFQWVVGIMEIFAVEVVVAVVGWQGHNISLSDLLRLPEHEFQKKRTSLISYVDDNLQRSKAFRESRGDFEISGGFKPGIERKFTNSSGLSIGSGVTPSG